MRLLNNRLAYNYIRALLLGCLVLLGWSIVRNESLEIENRRLRQRQTTVFNESETLRDAARHTRETQRRYERGEEDADTYVYILETWFYLTEEYFPETP